MADTAPLVVGGLGLPGSVLGFKGKGLMGV